MLYDSKIRAFLAVTEEGSFTAAARKLGVSQPAVSAQISALEEVLGCPLLVRGAALQLTPAGETFRDYARMLQTHEVDGCIITSLDVPEAELLKLSQEAPVVCACEPVKSRRIPVVSIDDEAAAYETVSFLISKGKKKIALFGAGDLYYSSSLRLKGALHALRENGITPFYQSDEGYSFRSGSRALSAMLLAKAELPDAIFCFSDSCAIGTISALDSHGFKVPQDVSVIGFDNTAISEMFVPSLTTVAQPQHAIGYKAADLLIRQIEGKPIEKKRYALQHEIILRDSMS